MLCTYNKPSFVEVTDVSSSRWHSGKRLFWYAWKIPSSCALRAELRVLHLHALTKLEFKSMYTSAQTEALACSFHRRVGEFKVIHIGAPHERTSKGVLCVCFQ